MANKGETGILTLYSDVQATAVRWLWYPFIAVGKITLLQGDPGDGKSTMMMNLIAELSKGGNLPDGKIIGMPQRIIYQCSEDGVSDTIKPRLEKCGADCRNVAFINEETYSGLTLDDERIRQAIIEFRPRLVVIDPIQAYLGSDSDLQIAGRARKLMQRLGMWASVYDCAIVLIGHLNKKEGTKGLYRSLGSIDVVAAARSVLQVERDPKDPDIRIVRQIKNSLAPSDIDVFAVSRAVDHQEECVAALGLDREELLAGVIHDVILYLAVACDGERNLFFLRRLCLLDHLCRFLRHLSGVHKGKGRGRKAHRHQQGQNCAGDNNSQPFKHLFQSLPPFLLPPKRCLQRSGTSHCPPECCPAEPAVRARPSWCCGWHE